MNEPNNRSLAEVRRKIKALAADGVIRHTPEEDEAYLKSIRRMRLRSNISTGIIILLAALTGITTYLLTH